MVRRLFFVTSKLFNNNFDVFVYCFVVLSFYSSNYLVDSLRSTFGNYDLTLLVNLDVSVVCLVGNSTNLLGELDSLLAGLVSFLNRFSFYCICISRD